MRFRHILLLMLVAAVAPRSAPAQSPEEEGRRFLRGLTAVDNRILGSLEYRMLVFTREIGRIVYTIEASTHEGRAAYLFRAEGAQSMEDLPKGALRAEAWFSPSLACLSWHNVEVREDPKTGKRSERTVDCRLRGSRIERTLAVDGQAAETQSVEWEEGLLVGPAQGPLLLMLLDLTRPRTLVFPALSEGRKIRLRLVVGTEEEVTVGGVKTRAVLITKTEESPEPPPDARTPVVTEEYFWMRPDGRMLAHAFRDNPKREELLTDEVRRQVAAAAAAPPPPPGPRDAVVRFFHAMADGKPDGIREVLDVDRFFTDRAASDARFAALNPGQLAAVKTQFVEDFARRSADEDVRRCRIYTADFFEETIDGDEADVRFVPEFRKTSPAVERYRFRLYRAPPAWRIFRIEN